MGWGWGLEKQGQIRLLPQLTTAVCGLPHLSKKPQVGILRSGRIRDLMGPEVQEAGAHVHTHTCTHTVL